MSISRRRFLETASAGALVATAFAGESNELKTPLPTRVLGRTGVRVSILAIGAGSRFLSFTDEDKAIGALNHALDLGITYIDTAYAYGAGKSEERVGMVMKTRRNSVFLSTKMAERNGDKAMKIIEGSLKRLQTTQLDMIHIHSLTSEADLEQIEAKGGILETLLKLRDQKVIRFVGITCHTDPTVLKTALERNDFDCTQMALNAALVGMKGATGGMVINPDMKPSFESIALPVARKKNLGVIAMKLFAADGLTGQAPAAKLMYYSLSLPGVSSCVVGMPTLELMDENVKLAKAFQKMPQAEMEQLANALSSKNKVALDRYFRQHVDEYPA